MFFLRIFFVAIIICTSFGQNLVNTEVAKEHDVAFQLTNIQEFLALASLPTTSKFSNVKSVKLVYSISDDSLYFMNSVKYKFHYDFCREYLLDTIDLELFNQRNYHLHAKRKYLLLNFNYYKDQEKFVVELFPGEECKSEWLYSASSKLVNRIKFESTIAILNNNKVISNFVPPEGVSVISSDDLYKGQTYQCLKGGVAYGYLKFVKSGDVSKSDLKSTDIVVLDNLPLHLPWVQGVVTDVFQTPLSHINVLCSNRGIPNCSWKGAWENKGLRKYENSLVKIQFREDKIYITSATLEQAKRNWDLTDQKEKISVVANIKTTRVLSIKELSKMNVNVAGAKAFNFSLLSQLKTSSGKSINTPENAFAIPFYFYVQHLNKSCIPEIDSLMFLPLPENSSIVKQQLKKIRKSIEQTPVDSSLLNSVIRFMKQDKRFSEYRFRSSTNAEDIEGFNGAGLYESHTGSLKDTSKKVEDAIRKVWSSLWNYEAFMEREYFSIDHYTVAMGILVHRAFGEEKANGVCVTKHLYRTGYPAYTLNLQLGELSVVSPEEGVRAEQFILVFKGFENETDYSTDIITYSSESPGKLILSPRQLKQLVEFLRAIKKYYYTRTDSKEYYYDYALDIEFKLDAVTDQIYIKQVRPYR